MTLGRRPAIGIPASSRILEDGRPSYALDISLTNLLVAEADVLPVILPLTGAGQTAMLERLDGLLLPSFPSHLQPWIYNGAMADPELSTDPARDETTLPLVRAAAAIGLPILGLGLGLQEMNVALGGTLLPDLAAVPGRSSHQLGDNGHHSVRLTGLLARICGHAVMPVNSMHIQAIDEVAPNVAIEALAEDGTIEAIRLLRSDFAIGVQWSPEWDPVETESRRALLRAFGEACRDWALQREGEAA